MPSPIPSTPSQIRKYFILRSIGFKPATAWKLSQAKLFGYLIL
jgi:hypothetical protein